MQCWQAATNSCPSLVGKVLLNNVYFSLYFILDLHEFFFIIIFIIKHYRSVWLVTFLGGVFSLHVELAFVLLIAFPIEILRILYDG